MRKLFLVLALLWPLTGHAETVHIATVTEIVDGDLAAGDTVITGTN